MGEASGTGRGDRRDRGRRIRAGALAPAVLAVAAMAAVAACGGSGAPATTKAPASAGPAGLAGLNVTATVKDLELPTELVATGDAVWAIAHGTGEMVRIDPKTNTITKRIPLGGSFANTLELINGRLWSFAQDAGKVVAVDPATDAIVASVTAGGDGDSLAAGPDGLWLESGGTKLIHVDAKTASIDRTLTMPAECHGAIVATPDAIFVGEGGALCKLSPADGSLMGSSITTGAGNGWGMAFDGTTLWIPAAGGIIGVDPAGPTLGTPIAGPAAGTFQGATWSLGSAGDNAFVGPAPSGLWVRYSEATLAHLDTGSKTWALYAGLPPGSLGGGDVIEAFGSLWVTNPQAGTIERVDLPKP